MMRRGIGFLVTLALGLLVAPLLANAQLLGRVPWSGGGEPRHRVPLCRWEAPGTWLIGPRQPFPM